jgi:hypothetical protein
MTGLVPNFTKVGPLSDAFDCRASRAVCRGDEDFGI